MITELQMASFLLAATLNGVLSYEAISERHRWWRIAIPSFTTAAFLLLAAGKAGLLDFLNA